MYLHFVYSLDAAHASPILRYHDISRPTSLLYSCFLTRQTCDVGLQPTVRPMFRAISRYNLDLRYAQNIAIFTFAGKLSGIVLLGSRTDNALFTLADIVADKMRELVNSTQQKFSCFFIPTMPFFIPWIGFNWSRVSTPYPT